MMKFKKSALILGVSLSALIALPAFAQEQTSSEGTVTVLGSRIKRINKEGPAPVTVVDSTQIKAGGYSSVPDILKASTQNGGETYGQQNGTVAVTTPGATTVDLRGLGPNHTLVMVNGRRIADFPLPYGGISNFTDISAIPTSMIDKMEILSGSASAIYGSDAISGVVNFNLKKKADGTTLSYKHGITEHGGGASDRLSVSTGFEKDKFSLVFGAEYFKQDPIFGYQRNIQDSNLDSPYAKTKRPEVVYGEYDYDYDAYGSVGPNDCSAVSGQFYGTVSYQTNYWDEPYCGSYNVLPQRTMTSDKSSLNTFTSMNYELSDTASIFADIMIGQSNTKLLRRIPSWQYQDIDGNEAYYYNAATDVYGSFVRIFTPEEAGGINNMMTRAKSKTISATLGFKNSFGDGWNYEVTGNYSKANAEMRIPLIVASKANAFFLGSSYGTDFDVPIANFLKPLTPAQYASISETFVSKADSSNGGVSFVLNKDSLFTLPAGDVGFALIAELDKQSYDINPSANSTNFGYYYGYAATDGGGSRTHGAIGVELKAPILDKLDANFAARYDKYKFSGGDMGEVTYNAGLEYRPVNSLLLRAAYGTGFRAPDLHYIFAKPDLYHPTDYDVYQCRVDNGGDCYANEDYSKSFLEIRQGTSKLDPETSNSFNLGTVWQPNKLFDISIDYFNVTLKDEVQDIPISQILRDEAACKLGTDIDGNTVNTSSAACVDALSRVVRYTTGPQAGDIQTVYVSPYNVSEQKTSGIDVEAHFNIVSNFAKYRISLGHTEVFDHTIVKYAGDAKLDMLAADSSYYIPAQKSNASISMSKGPLTATLSGTRLGKFQNWNEDDYVKPSYLYNANIQYDINDKANLSFTVRNLLDTKPGKDPTYRSYPYYDTSWFDATGRSYYLELTYKF
ncbi:TonB-dependent receptor plug domain-containing protein [Pseudaquidulcibacter saccharophilus]|uniref:TonB-dependent receptor plug domain-containing protein n=1 Tax=Pseudaquidulcibacter saccharophilus TaxID=2831900 RepID=UPI001EFEFB53|nr:TonB-dependent receptor [Pseudaquidulcibacter saccharophilus]